MKTEKQNNTFLNKKLNPYPYLALLGLGGITGCGGSSGGPSPNPRRATNSLNRSFSNTDPLFAGHNYASYNARNSVAFFYNNDGSHVTTQSPLFSRAGLKNCENPALNGKTFAATCNRTNSDLYSIVVMPDVIVQKLIVFPSTVDPNGQNYEDVHLYSPAQLNYTGSEAIDQFVVCKRRPDNAVVFLALKDGQLTQRLVVRVVANGVNLEIGQTTVTNNLILFQALDPTITDVTAKNDAAQIVGYNLNAIGSILSDPKMSNDHKYAEAKFRGGVVFRQYADYGAVATHNSEDGVVVVVHDQSGAHKHDQLEYFVPGTRIKYMLSFSSQPNTSGQPNLPDPKTIDLSDPTIAPGTNDNTLNVVCSENDGKDPDTYFYRGFRFTRDSMGNFSGGTVVPMDPKIVPIIGQYSLGGVYNRPPAP